VPIQRTLQQEIKRRLTQTKKLAPKRQKKQAPKKELHAMHIPHRSPKPALSHRRILEKIRQKRVLRKKVR
jgi:hypothetical protein